MGWLLRRGLFRQSYLCGTMERVIEFCGVFSLLLFFAFDVCGLFVFCWGSVVGFSAVWLLWVDGG